MIYREHLIMRKAVVWFLGIFAASLFSLGLVSHGRIVSDGSDATILLGPGTMITSIFAAIFGVALGNASREPARVIWVLPIERWRSAVAVLVVDLAGITVTFVGVMVVWFSLLALERTFGAHFRFGSGVDWHAVLESLCFVYAIYGWGALFGTFWRRFAYFGIAAAPFLLFWMTFAHSSDWFGATLRSLIVLNPYAVASTSFMLRTLARAPIPLNHMDTVTNSLLWMGTTWEPAVLGATALVTCGIAVLLWQRAEVIV